MTAQLDLIAEPAPAQSEPEPLPRGPGIVYARALANGFRVDVHRGSAVVEKGVRQYLHDEDGQPVTTAKGAHRFTIATVPTIVASIGLALQHDDAQQGQCGWWVEKFVEGWAWPSIGGDVQRTITATQLGTLVDLAALREQSLAHARAAQAQLEQDCRCIDCTIRRRTERT